MSKKFEINLTPQNQEWINLIPNPNQNNDIIFNKILEVAINDGTMLETISQSLTLADLAKFKTMYTKLQAKRAEYMNELEIKPSHTERRKSVSTIIETVQEVEEQEQPVVTPTAKENKTSKTSGKKMSHGFDEDTF